MNALSEANAAARATCARLRGHFDLPMPRLPEWSLPVEVPIGLEIEVPWRSYFPELWVQFDLQHRGFRGLSAEEARELTRLCTQQEERVRPLLQSTTDCGVPRGGDKYWEFAFAPAGDLALQAHLVSLLTACGALPRDRRHALHITIGDVAPCPNLYFLLMALELRHVEPERLRAGPAAAAAGPIFTGWMRKGRSGVLRKEGGELELGSIVASELRTLQLPTTDAEFHDLLQTLAWGVGCLTGRAPREVMQKWNAFVADARASLRREGLPAGNWADAEDALAVWNRFADALPRLRDELDHYLPRAGAEPETNTPAPRMRLLAA
jgi:hypothetical protein